MLFRDIIGLENIKSHLTNSVDKNRIPHAQLFVGAEGSGTLPMAIAYAQYVLCKNKKGENSDVENPCNIKCNNLSHPDLHFAFPVATTTKIKSKPISNDFLVAWRTYIKQNPYTNLYQWMQFLDIEKKQGLIGKNEALEIAKKLSLKSFEGGYKVMIIWMADKMNIAAANKLLKLIEEPPEKTLLLLIAEDEEQIIKTILSRCQVLHFPKVSEENIVKTLIANGVSDNEALKIAHQANGNWNKALQLTIKNEEQPIFETWFITWIRAAFRAKGNASVVEDLIHWSADISKTGRETQKQFLQYCLHFFRQAMLMNYKAEKLVYLETKSPNFDLKKFAPFIHSGNMVAINNTLNDAIYHIERNGSAKIILLDISIKLTRLLHAKEN